MSYQAEYNQSDISAMVIDGMGKAGSIFVQWLDIIILLVFVSFVAYGFLRVYGRQKRRRR